MFSINFDEIFFDIRGEVFNDAKFLNLTLLFVVLLLILLLLLLLLFVLLLMLPDVLLLMLPLLFVLIHYSHSTDAILPTEGLKGLNLFVFIICASRVIKIQFGLGLPLL